MIPTQRSVNARQLNKSFDGGWIEVTFWRATIVKRFPGKDVMAVNKKNEWKPITIWIKLNTLKLDTLWKITTKITVKPTKYQKLHLLRCWRNTAELLQSGEEAARSAIRRDMIACAWNIIWNIIASGPTE